MGCGASNYVLHKNINDDELLYKIISEEEWKESLRNSYLLKTGKDMKKGYIHCLFYNQIDNVERKKSDRNVVLTLSKRKINENGFTVRYEKNLKGDIYPHIYAIKEDDRLPLETILAHSFL